MVMSRPSDRFQTFYKAYEALVNSELVLSNIDDPRVSAYVTVCKPSVFDIDAFFTGNEAGGKIEPLVVFCQEFLHDL